MKGRLLAFGLTLLCLWSCAEGLEPVDETLLPEDDDVVDVDPSDPDSLRTGDGDETPGDGQDDPDEDLGDGVTNPDEPSDDDPSQDPGDDPADPSIDPPVDAGDAGGSDGSSPSTCTGKSVGGYCWFLAPDNVSCTDHCQSEGRSYSTATRTYAGSASTASNARCLNVMKALGVKEYSEVSTVTILVAGLGCYLNLNGLWNGIYRDIDTLDDTKSSAKSEGRRRACACKS